MHVYLIFGPYGVWGGPEGLRVAPNEKVAYHKSFLKFDFRGGHFYEKIQNSKIFVAHPATSAFRPRYFRPGAKIQNSAPYFL